MPFLFLIIIIIIISYLYNTTTNTNHTRYLAYTLLILTTTTMNDLYYAITTFTTFYYYYYITTITYSNWIPLLLFIDSSDFLQFHCLSLQLLYNILHSSILFAVSRSIYVSFLYSLTKPALMVRLVRWGFVCTRNAILFPFF
ncbi:hypothetical protein BDF22DRAFT_413847 [Syncephalis plumigaleata]|nr:hypothetical protein BDF22DRAFT_413847 [Syncephalis plumigaleata]